MRLEELRASALELRIEAELALGRHAHLIGELQGLVGEHPLRERLWAQLMTALYRDGRQADALAAYRAARERLIEEIGIEPGPELRALESRVLAQDPALAVHDTPTAQPSRAALAVCTDSSGPAAVAERLAAASGVEAVAVALLRDAGRAGRRDRRAARARRRARASPRSRARRRAMTRCGSRPSRTRRSCCSSAPQDGRLDPDLAAVLRAAACDVALVAGGAPAAEGPVLVPFSGGAHDWAAAELGASLGGGAVTLLGAAGGAGRRDASRLLANASLALQRGAGRARRDGARRPRRRRRARGGRRRRRRRDRPLRALAAGGHRTRPARGSSREAPCPVLLVRRGVRPGTLAPPEALTRFSWSGGG